jgi:hypothetical protein
MQYRTASTGTRNLNWPSHSLYKHSHGLYYSRPLIAFANSHNDSLLEIISKMLCFSLPDVGVTSMWASDQELGQDSCVSVYLMLG